MLIIEVDGSDETQVLADIESIAEIARATVRTEVKVAQNDKNVPIYGRPRRSISPSLARRRPNKLGEDISYHVQNPGNDPAYQGHFPEVQLAHRRVRHAGDGNLHPNILFDRRDPDEWERVQLITKELFSTAVELGGTLSGEHGVGTLKLPYLDLESLPMSSRDESDQNTLDPLAFSIRAEFV